MYTNLQINKLDNSEIEIQAQISEKTILKYKERAIKQLSKNIKIDGFREGYIPEKILVNKIGEQEILEEQTKIALADAYPEIVKTEKLSVIGRPEIIITKLAPNNPIEFKIKTAIIPEVILPDYKKISSKIEKIKNINNVTEKEIGVKEKRRIDIVEAIIKETKIDIPKILIGSEIDKMMAQFKDDIVRMNMVFEEYLKKIKKTEDNLRTEWGNEAQKRAKLQLILNKISIQEKIKIPEEDIKRETDNILKHYKNAKPENVRVYIESVLTNEKVFQLLENFS